MVRRDSLLAVFVGNVVGLRGEDHDELNTTLYKRLPGFLGKGNIRGEDLTEDLRNCRLWQRNVLALHPKIQMKFDLGNKQKFAYVSRFLFYFILWKKKIFLISTLLKKERKKKKFSFLLFI